MRTRDERRRHDHGAARGKTSVSSGRHAATTAAPTGGASCVEGHFGQQRAGRRLNGDLQTVSDEQHRRDPAGQRIEIIRDRIARPA